ncbi:MAG: emp24/gp25L/p24 family protein [Candidatus Binatia bacterium]|nr:emp24/gp25L/p24 family protein [Candidatus Binatia bacterium]
MKTLTQFRTATLIGLLLLTNEAMAQKSIPTTHTIFMTAVELKGATTIEKLVPPSVNPKDLSKGYDYKPPAQADKNDPKKWEVSSYRFDPGFVTVIQGDTVKLTVFIVNGDEHDVRIADPDGRDAITVTKWNRGREYNVSFVAKKLGSYQLICSAHAPTMTTTILVLPRK